MEVTFLTAVKWLSLQIIFRVKAIDVRPFLLVTVESSREEKDLIFFIIKFYFKLD